MEQLTSQWVYNDGGRSNYFKGSAGDCGPRAVAIATGMDYKEVYDRLFAIQKEFVEKKRARVRSKRWGRIHNKTAHRVREGTWKETVQRFMAEIGWIWKPTMFIGRGCKVHLQADELPKGNLVVCVSKHYTAVIDGIINDTYNPNDRVGITTIHHRDGTVEVLPVKNRCVYGYFYKGA
jgi:hypothetical protein